MIKKSFGQYKDMQVLMGNAGLGFMGSVCSLLSFLCLVLYISYKTAK